MRNLPDAVRNVRDALRHLSDALDSHAILVRGKDFGCVCLPAGIRLLAAGCVEIPELPSKVVQAVPYAIGRDYVPQVRSGLRCFRPSKWELEGRSGFLQKAVGERI